MENKEISDLQLLLETKGLVGEERKVISKLIVSLKEIEDRELQTSCGFGSLFAYCLGELRYSRAETQVRIQAMRLYRELPSIAQEIADGEVTLSIVAEAQGFFKREQKSGRPVSIEQKREIIDTLKAYSHREAEVWLQERFHASPKMKKMTFYASPELRQKLDRVKGLLAHQNYDGDLAKLVEILVDKELERFDESMKEKPVRTSQPKGRTRFIHKATRRKVWLRAGGTCEYVDPVSGRRCNSQHALEVDHIHPYSLGGSNNISNLRLLCDAHNKFRNSPNVPPHMRPGRHAGTAPPN